MAVFELISAPAFTNNHEVWVDAPKSFAQLNKEWVWVVVHVVGVPVPMVFVSDYDLAVHHLFLGVCGLIVNIFSVQLFPIHLQNLRPRLPVVKMNAIDTHCGGKTDNLFNQHLPRLKLSIVEHS